MWAVVGLGNPGSDYARTRHNAGFLFVRRLAREWGVRLDRRRCRSRLGDARRGRTTVVLALPQTFMNLSGLAVRALLDSRRIPPERLVVVSDDLDLPLGRIRLRAEGGAGTHLGMKSVIREIGTTGFPRLRLGIGPKPEAADAADFVLDEFAADEWEALEQGFDRAREALDLVLEGRVAEAMNRVNTLLAPSPRRRSYKP
ncbi:MAG: aminoacyl-tRNA hydrolase [Candidatus Aminicenantes bacterium RBG_13_63_10]|nr:MAG: aminoacyl-tRNA hydrolase [Candidatus Aminicenantes bacterium RBG_13_63_10]